MAHPLSRSLAVALLLLTIASAHAAEREGLIVPFRKVSVSSPVQGIMADMLFAEGDAVPAGQVIAQINDNEEQLELARLQLILEKRKADAEATVRLLADNLISADEAMEKRIEFEVGKLQVASAQLAVDRKQITAPLSGVIVRRNREPGEWVNPGEVLYEIIPMDPVHVEVLLDGREGIRLRRGMEVRVRIADLEYLPIESATIVFIDPRIDASSGLMIVRALLDNPSHAILPGMRALVSFPELTQETAAANNTDTAPRE